MHCNTTLFFKKLVGLLTWASSCEKPPCPESEVEEETNAQAEAQKKDEAEMQVNV